MAASIKDLLEKDKWEVRTLGEIAIDISSGTGVLERQWNTGNFPAIRNKDISDFDSHVYKCAIGVNPDLIKIKRYCSYGDLLVSHLVNPKKIGKSCVWLGEGKCLVGKNITIVKHNQNPKYLSHALSSDFCVKQISSTSHKSIYITLFPNLLKQIKVPLPPRHVQDLLGEFLYELIQSTTELSEKLKREIEARKRRFQFYINELLKGGIIDWESLYPGSTEDWFTKPLEDIAVEVYSGVEQITKKIGTGNYPAIRNNFGQIPRKFHRAPWQVELTDIKSRRFCEYGDLLVSIDGDSNIGKTATYLGSEQCLVASGVAVIKHQENPSFLAWTLSTSEFQTKVLMGMKTIFPRITLKELKKIPVTLPPRPIQDLIANHLDQLYEREKQMEKDLTDEIELRTQQVQQIREELLEYSSNHRTLRPTI